MTDYFTHHWPWPTSVNLHLCEKQGKNLLLWTAAWEIRVQYKTCGGVVRHINPVSHLEVNRKNILFCKIFTCSVKDKPPLEWSPIVLWALQTAPAGMTSVTLYHDINQSYSTFMLKQSLLLNTTMKLFNQFHNPCAWSHKSNYFSSNFLSSTQNKSNLQYIQFKKMQRKAD